MTVLVGGVGQLYQGDHDLPRHAVERLAKDQLGPDVLVEDFYYGAVAVAQRLQEVRPTCLILIGTEERGRAPGTVERRRIHPEPRDVERVQRAVGDAVTGYVTLEIALDVLAGLDALPARTIVYEVEPENTYPAEELSPAAGRALVDVMDLVRAEISRAPLFELVKDLGDLLEEEHLAPAPVVEILKDLLLELAAADLSGSWGTTFALRDRLRRAIAEGATGEGMSHLDWGLWWVLIEELDRLQSAEASSTT